MSESQVIAFLLQCRKVKIDISDETHRDVTSEMHPDVTSETPISALRRCSKNAITCDSDIQWDS